MSVVRCLTSRERGLYRNKSLDAFAEFKATRFGENKPCSLRASPVSLRSTFLVVFSPDSTKIGSTHGDHNVRVTDLKTGLTTHVLEGHKRTPWCLAFHPERNHLLASGCLAGEVRIWDLQGGGSESWQCNTVIASLAFHPTDHLLVIASGNQLHFWDWTDDDHSSKLNIDSSKPFASQSTRSPHEKVRWVKFDPLGHYVYTGITNSPTLNHDGSNYAYRGDECGDAGNRSESADGHTDDTMTAARQQYQDLLQIYNREIPNALLAAESSSETSDDEARPLSPAVIQRLQQSRMYAQSVTNQVNEHRLNCPHLRLHSDRLRPSDVSPRGNRLSDVGLHSNRPSDVGPHGSTNRPSDVFQHSSRPSDVGLHSNRPSDVVPHSNMPRDVGPHSNRPSDVGPHSNRPSDVVPHSNMPRDVGPHSNRPSDVVLHSNRPRDVGPHSNRPSDVVLHSNRPRDVGPHSNRPSDVVLHSNMPRDVVLHSNRPRDVGPYSNRPSDVVLHSNRPRDVGPHSNMPRDGNLTQPGPSRGRSAPSWSRPWTWQRPLNVDSNPSVSRDHISAWSPWRNMPLSSHMMVSEMMGSSAESLADSARRVVSAMRSLNPDVPVSQRFDEDDDGVNHGQYNFLTAAARSHPPGTPFNNGQNLTAIPRPVSPQITLNNSSNNFNSMRAQLQNNPLEHRRSSILRSQLFSLQRDSPENENATSSQSFNAQRISLDNERQQALDEFYESYHQPPLRNPFLDHDSTISDSEIPTIVISGTEESSGLADPRIGSAAAAYSATDSDDTRGNTDANVAIVRDSWGDRPNPNPNPNQTDGNSNQRRTRPNYSISARLRSQISHIQNQQVPVQTLAASRSEALSTLHARQEMLRRRLDSLHERYQRLQENIDHRGRFNRPGRENFPSRNDSGRRLSREGESARRGWVFSRMRANIARQRLRDRQQETHWRLLHRRYLHPHYAHSILDDTINRPPDLVQDTINRTISGAFMASGQHAVADNIINLTHRIQRWDLRDSSVIPDITRYDDNVIVSNCQLHNDATADISQDGRFLATFVNNHRGFPDIIILAVFSLQEATLGQCLYTKSFGPNAISVSLSPLNNYVLVGLAAKRLAWISTASQLMGQVFKLTKPKAGEKSMEHISDLHHQCNNPSVSHVSVNVARWLPESGTGVCYGTNRGDLHICRPGVKRAKKKKDESADDSDNDAHSIRRHVLQMLEISVPRTLSISTQTSSNTRQSASTQTEGSNSDSD